jgi:hypothetical protein
MEERPDIEDASKRIPHFGIQRNQTTRASEDIIWSSWYVVEFEPEVSNVVSQWIFSTDFVCSIDSKRFTVRLTGDIGSLMQANTVKSGRKNPLLEAWIFSIKKLIRPDLGPDTIFELLGADWNKIPTNLAFWQEFRRRIPSTHPLSTINPPLS